MTFAPVVHRLPMMSLDNAFARDRAGGLGRPAPSPAGRGRGGDRLRLRAQDRRAGHLHPLRGRSLRAGRHPRRRAGRRGRHRQRRHHRPGPGQAEAGRARRARGAGRGLHVELGVRGAQRQPGRARAAPVRQPTQLGGGVAAPEGRRGHGRTRAVDVDLPAGRDPRRAPLRQPPRDARAARRPRLPGQPGDRTAVRPR